MSVLPLSVLNTAYIALGIFVETKYCTTDIRIFIFFLTVKKEWKSDPGQSRCLTLKPDQGHPVL